MVKPTIIANGYAYMKQTALIYFDEQVLRKTPHGELAPDIDERQDACPTARMDARNPIDFADLNGRVQPYTRMASPWGSEYRMAPRVFRWAPGTSAKQFDIHGGGMTELPHHE